MLLSERGIVPEGSVYAEMKKKLAQLEKESQNRQLEGEQQQM